MATCSYRCIARSSISSNGPKCRAAASPLPSNSKPSSPLRFAFSRVPPQLGCVASMLPLHDAVVAARMTSGLGFVSRACRALSQGA